MSLFLFLVLTMILVGYMKTWRERRTFRNLEKETTHFHQDPDEIEQLYKLDEEIIYTDKDDYQLAIGYHNDIFKNGLKATVTIDHAVLPTSVEEKSKPSGDSTEMAASDDDTSARNNDTKVSSSFDEEESIDQNGVTEQYQNEANGKANVV